jgi:cobyrinic acid a,c-diamide synthase
VDLGPRVVFAGTHSGVGKTTVATGVMAALRRTGARVASAKVGPDYIDPGYHSLATGRPGRNLDAWICGEGAIAPLAARAATGSDILVVEGVMGLFDGVSDPDAMTLAGSVPDPSPIASDLHVAPASTAAVAAALGAPVVLVVDASAMSGSAAAVVSGFDGLSPRIRLAGVVLNRIGSDAHLASVSRAVESVGVPVLGALRRDDRLRWRDRHLGLVPVAENPDSIRASLELLADVIASSVDLERIERIATAAPAVRTSESPRATNSGSARIAVAAGPAFSFTYPENLERLEEAGAEILPFDPTRETELPTGADALFAGGGFPETYAQDLAENRRLLCDVRRKVSGGLVTWAECGGLVWLSRGIDGRKLCGVIDADAEMTGTLSLGYRLARPRRDNPVAGSGTVLRGHEFHYSSLEPSGDALETAGRQGTAVSGYSGANMLASYVHLHLGSAPEIAERFVSIASGARRPRQ